MIVALTRFFYEWIFKPRYVYRYSLCRNIEEVYNVKVVSGDVLNEELNDFNLTKRLKGFVVKRNSKSWVLFLYLEKKEIVAYSFLHIPDKIEWLDSIPTKPGQARTCSTFVEPKYRGKRIRGILMDYQKKYCEDYNLDLFSIIEKVNVSSRRSAERSGGYIYRKNYLVKFFKHNIFSILLNPLEIYFLIGSKKESR